MTPLNNSDKIIQCMEKNNDILNCGIECDGGWIKILDPLFGSIRNHIKFAKIENFKITQVKEKFGTLRVYTSNSDEYINGLLDMAENMSEITCECCGKDGKTRTDGWFRTLCDDCNNQK